MKTYKVNRIGYMWHVYKIESGYPGSLCWVAKFDELFEAEEFVRGQK